MIADCANMELETKTRSDPKTGIVFREEHSFFSPAGERQKEASGFHRADGPAIVYRDRASGVTLVEHYFRFGCLSRTDGPASIKRDPATSIVTQEDYAVDGIYHRIDGPARIERHPTTGKVLSEAYYRNGKPHNEVGPSFVLYDERGNVLRADYFIEGKEVAPIDLQQKRKEKDSAQISMSWCATITDPGANKAQRGMKRKSRPSNWPRSEF